MKNTDISGNPLIVFKYGGNAMVNPTLEKDVLKNICKLKENGFNVVIVHGGGPFIKEILEKLNIHSEFIEGHRKTTTEALEYIKMALKGKVNSKLVNGVNSLGFRAVGISGEDGGTVIAAKRLHKAVVDGKTTEVDLGQVGDVAEVNTVLIRLLLKHGYIPVISCLAADPSGEGFNVNADMFAGHIAGALAARLVVLTDVDGLMKDKNNPQSLIQELNLSDIVNLRETQVIQGGMIPKIESCEIALHKGAESAHIINGTVPDQISLLASGRAVGTKIVKGE